MSNYLSDFVCSVGSLFARVYLMGRTTPDWADVERVLTDGYARALGLELECWRLEQRIGEIRALNGHGDAGEARRLRAKHTQLDRDVRWLRSLLDELHEYGAALRNGAGAERLPA